MVVNAIITAGGTSSRFGKSNKLLAKINGKEVIRHTVEAFRNSNVDKIIICANVGIIDELKTIFADCENVEIIQGGGTRQQSVFNGLKHSKCDYALIHDGARPVISPELINICIETVKNVKALSVMTKTTDTIKVVEDGKIIQTLDRSKLYNTQTPQAFEYDLIYNAHVKFADESFTDDAGLVEALGKDVSIVEGSYKNIKITTQSDVALASTYLAEL